MVSGPFCIRCDPSLASAGPRLWKRTPEPTAAVIDHLGQHVVWQSYFRLNPVRVVKAGHPEGTTELAPKLDAKIPFQKYER